MAEIMLEPLIVLCYGEFNDWAMMHLLFQQLKKMVR